MVVGIGSITDGAAASLYMQLEAGFIVTAAFKKDIAIDGKFPICLDAVH